jgi:hypothetical protein
MIESFLRQVSLNTQRARQLGQMAAKEQEMEGLDLKPQQHYLELNGTLEWERNLNSNIKCLCGHAQSKHLDGQTICLSRTKTDPNPLFAVCFCEEFKTSSKKSALVE